MAKSTFNTVVAKALFYEIQQETTRAAKELAEKTEKDFKKSRQWRQYLSLRAKADQIDKQADELKAGIAKQVSSKSPKFMYADVYHRDMTVRSKVSVNQEAVMARMILLAHQGKTLEEIRAIIKKRVLQLRGTSPVSAGLF